MRTDSSSERSSRVGFIEESSSQRHWIHIAICYVGFVCVQGLERDIASIPKARSSMSWPREMPQTKAIH
eukprot:675410-Amphidinium_carterae.1